MTDRKTPRERLKKTVEDAKARHKPEAGASTTNPDTPWGGVTDPGPEEIAAEKREDKPEPVRVEWCCREHAIIDYATLANASGFLHGSKAISKDDPIDQTFDRVLGLLRRQLVPSEATKPDTGAFTFDLSDLFSKGGK